MGLRRATFREQLHLYPDYNRVREGNNGIHMRGGTLHRRSSSNKFTRDEGRSRQCAVVFDVLTKAAVFTPEQTTSCFGRKPCGVFPSLLLNPTVVRVDIFE